MTRAHAHDQPEATSYPLHKIKVVLLEGVHALAEESLAGEGYQVERHAGALEGDDAYLLRLANQSLFGDCLVALGSALVASGAQAAVSSPAAGARVPLRAFSMHGGLASTEHWTMRWIRRRSNKGVRLEN